MHLRSLIFMQFVNTGINSVYLTKFIRMISELFDSSYTAGFYKFCVKGAIYSFFPELLAFDNIKNFVFEPFGF